MSIDLTEGLFHCFGCGAAGGLRRFAELVGEGTAVSRPVRRQSPADAARCEILRHARAQDAQAAEWVPLHYANDHIRRSYAVVRKARAIATEFGESDPRTWPLLDLAARVEREVLDVETELDVILMGRVA